MSASFFATTLLILLVTCVYTASAVEGQGLRGKDKEEVVRDSIQTVDDPRIYQQCGGKQYNGDTTCGPGLVCLRWHDDWYYQCRPESDKACDVAGDYTYTRETLQLVDGELVKTGPETSVWQITDHGTGFFEINRVPFLSYVQSICAFKMETDNNKPERTAICADISDATSAEITFSTDCKSFVVTAWEAHDSDNITPSVVRATGVKTTPN